MSAVHGLLSKLPDSLNYEQLIRVAAALFERHPPKQVAKKGRLKMSNRSVLEWSGKMSWESVLYLRVSAYEVAYMALKL